MGINVVHTLIAQAAERPDAPALIATRRGRDRSITFAQLDADSARRAALFRNTGLRPGDAVLILQPVSIDLYVTLLAVFRAGLVAMFLDPSAGRAHIERCCALRTPDALVGPPKAHLLRLISRALRRVGRHFVQGRIPIPGATSLADADRLRPLADIHPCEPDTPALLTFTSGSTGQPKAAVRSHGLLAAQHGALHRALALTPGESDLTTLPIFVLANLASGVTSLVPDADLRRPGRIDAAPVIEQVLRHRPTTTVASPALLLRLASHCRERGITLPSFRQVFTGGAPVFPPTVEALRAMAPAAKIVTVYGSTEAEPISHVAHDELSPEDHRATRSGGGLPAGQPVPEVRLRILPDQFGRPIGPFTAEEFEGQCLGPETAGEIVVAGDHVLPGYLNGQGDAETKFRVDGRVWHRTGDAGRLDAGGRIWLLGRCAARIDDARGSLYPFGVECAATGTPGVARAALVAVKGRRVLVVESEPQSPGPDVKALKDGLAWAWIDEVWSMPIPDDGRHNAKVDYPALRARIEREAAKS